ncbi:unnamed protein product, partial [Clonostachys rosea]
WIDVNYVWNRIEKRLFLLIDATLRIYFTYLIRIKLIASGLEKRTPLLTFDIAMVLVSISLDMILVGTISIGNSFIFIQTSKNECLGIKNHKYIVWVVVATGDSCMYRNERALSHSPSPRQQNNGISAVFSSQTRGGMEYLFSCTGKIEVHIDADGQATGKNTSRDIAKVIHTQVIDASRPEQDDASSQSPIRQMKNGTRHYHDTFA